MAPVARRGAHPQRTPVAMPASRDRSYEQAITDVLQQIRQAVDLVNVEIRHAQATGQRQSLVRRVGRRESLLQLAAALEILRDGG